MIKAFIQARMSSRRFPGKMLAPLHGAPVIRHVVERVAQVLPHEHIVLATSDETADDPLSCYVGALGIKVFRGPLNNVFQRFQLCLKEHPCAWFFRVCGDSPMLNTAVIREAIALEKKGSIQLVTNIFPRSFPKGQSMEMVKAETFATIGSDWRLTREEEEHVTKVYYNHPSRFDIVNIGSGDEALAELSYAIDTLEDLRRVAEAMRYGDA